MKIAAPLNHDPKPCLQWIEVATSFQIPSFHIIGLPSPEVSEARERIRAAIDASHLDFPKRRVVINLSPASVKKRGTGIDLAMALSILMGADPERPCPYEKVVAWGELGLDGSLKSAGQISRALYAAWEAEVDLLIIPLSEFPSINQSLELFKKAKAFQTNPPQILAAKSLTEAWGMLSGLQAHVPAVFALEISEKPAVRFSPPLLALPKLLERSLGISVSGKHHFLMLGSKGSGKSHAMEWLIEMQTPGDAQSLVTHSLFRELGTLESKNPSPIFRRVGMHARPNALIGSTVGDSVKPGEFTLAHGGILIADELPEWARDSREALREPLESGRITLNRVQKTLTLPAKFTLIANGNICPCGGWPTSLGGIEADLQIADRCKCTPMIRKQYLQRLSGPLLDRIDLLVLAGPHLNEEPSEAHPESISCLREQIDKSLNQALSLYGAPAGWLTPNELEDFLKRFPKTKLTLDSFKLSSLRSRHKLLRIALSLAIWDGQEIPREAHFMEGYLYRPERFNLLNA